MYNGLFFSEMNWKDKNHFDNFSISCADVEPLSDNQKYRYFVQLNTTGTPMDKDHLENIRKKIKEQ